MPRSIVEEGKSIPYGNHTDLSLPMMRPRDKRNRLFIRKSTLTAHRPFRPLHDKVSQIYLPRGVIRTCSQASSFEVR